MVTDPLGDMLIQIKNAGLAGKKSVDLPTSKLKQAVAQIMQEEGYLEKIEKIESEPQSRLHLVLKYQGKTSVITGVKRQSKPGLRLYVKSHEIPLVVGGMGMAIVSTPQGIMTGKKAKKLKLGGELLCTIW